ncbi:DNA processing protein DprA [Enterococcus florum]|uniref:DNA processing protein DprA n=1 Tax=Enterococcus florum TaxID=2480627 RepID=A0A4P5P941_9ENTE|nr:DNA-processing protein DprA [Enterococcus florum]GCF92814.1 DNA processing protein DprA [Enterococcus florum]
MDKTNFILRLSLVKGIGIATKVKIYRFVKKHDYWDLTLTEAKNFAKGKQIYDWEFWNEENLERIKQQHHYLTIESDRYPEELKQLPVPPLVLYYKGNLSLLEEKSLAIVGARAASDYGFQLIKQFMPSLIKHRFVIVSGLAKGIDSYAHQFAISSSGKTIGVIGTGLDICYPRESANLQIEMAKNHLLLSEYINGTPPSRFHFPMRNRIIAGLGQGVLVIEAKQKSGSLITAQQALDYGKEVFAVPGDVLNGRSSGCHQLIQDGALCVEKVQDIFDSFHLLKKIR